MYMYTCTSACNTRGEGGGRRGRELNNITAFIRHSTDPMAIENRGYKTMSSKILQNC